MAQGLLSPEWNDRLDHWIRVLKDDFYLPLGEIRWECFQTFSMLTPEGAEQHAFSPAIPETSWGKEWEYAWFRGDVTLPQEAEGQRIVLDLHPGGESTLYVNGVCFGTYRADWVVHPHHYLVDNTVTRRGKSGERFHILMETYAGHFFPGAAIDGVATGPVLPDTYHDPYTDRPRRTLGKCTYGIWNEAAYQLFIDVQTVRLLLDTLDSTSLRAAKLARSLQQFTCIVDFEQSRAKRLVCYDEARSFLRSVLQAKNGDTAPVFYAIANSHLDLAWLWPTAETIRKTVRTFAAQLRLMDEYPEYRYLQSQPAAYEMCRQYAPELFARIRKAVSKGQWIADGAMWVEPDTNMAGGESLIRQLLYGKRWYLRELGVDSQILWLPDTFGYSAALPQILQGCGVRYLVTQKIFWSYNGGEQFPYHYFAWEGMDGSRVTSFLPTSYVYSTDPKEINTTWKKRVQCEDLDAFLLPYGYGDGGGGPCRDHIEYIRRQENLEGGARVRIAGPLEFFEDMDRLGGPANTYCGELYFSAHRGTYTSQAKIKANNRHCETALREMEFWSSVAMQHGFTYDYTRAESLWKTLLFNQFHDILPGTVIARACREAEQAVEVVIAAATDMAAQAQVSLISPDAEALTIFNSLSFKRQAVIPLPSQFAGGAITSEDVPIPIGKTPNGLKGLVTLPPCGAVTLLPGRSNVLGQASVTSCPNGFLLRNRHIQALVNFRGEVISFVLLESGREFAASPLNHFLMYKDVPRLFDAWDIDSNYIEQEIDALSDVEVQPYSSGIEAAVRVTGMLGHSPFSQIIRLAEDARRIEFETEIDWQELHRLLKVSFPVTVYAEEGINEIQFGYVRRPTHRSTQSAKDRFEVCNHRYSALCDNSHGVAVLNDSKYGISMNGNVLELSLLRSPAAPEMRADNRRHHFTYAFTAWEGSFLDCDVVRQGYELNVPLQSHTGKITPFSMLSIEKENILLESMKPAEDDPLALILRLYECKKAAVHTAIQVGNAEVFLCDMLENPLVELPVTDGQVELDFRAFEIKTIKLVYHAP